jgi:hypothetical protein
VSIILKASSDSIIFPFIDKEIIEEQKKYEFPVSRKILFAFHLGDYLTDMFVDISRALRDNTTALVINESNYPLIELKNEEQIVEICTIRLKYQHKNWDGKFIANIELSQNFSLKDLIEYDN